MARSRQLDISFDDKAVHDAVMRMEQRVIPNKPRGSSVWDRVLAAVLDAEKEQFATQGEGFWARLSPKYAAWKAKHGGGQLLVFNGVHGKTQPRSLIGSLTERGNVYQRVSMGAELFRFASIDPTAHLHQNGQGVPKRPVVFLGTIYPKIKEALVESARDFERAWGGAS